jgi:hypothetical protein
MADPNQPKVIMIHTTNALRQRTHRQANPLLVYANGIGKHYGDIIAKN